MKGASKSYLESSRPNTTTRESIEFVLERLFADYKHLIGDEVVSGLTFEELIGALLLARDDISEE